MKILISLSAKQLGTLYHHTTKNALLKILRSGKLELSTGRAMTVENQHISGKNFFASLTRSRFGGYHFGDDGRTSIHENTSVMITLDGNALSAREKIGPVDYWQHRGDTERTYNRSKEYEERLSSNKPEIPILKYIKRVDLIQRAVHGEPETYGIDKGKFRQHPNEFHQKLLGSIILQLKKAKIPFAFYDSIDAWAHKRGEYSYIGPKDVHVAGGIGSKHYSTSYSYAAMKALIECLSDKPYDELSKKAQDISRQLANYPSDVDSVFNDYENYRKPDAEPTYRSLALKIARMLQRRGFNTKQEAGKFIADKAHAHYAQERKRDNDARSAAFAPLIAIALKKPVSEWPESSNTYLSLKGTFLGITDRFSYMYDEAERVVASVLKSDIAEVTELKAVMKSMHLLDAGDVVSHVYYEKVRTHNETQ